MKIALIGYGKMGKEVEKVAIERGHEIVSIIDSNNQKDFDTPQFLSAEIALEFSQPQSAFPNFLKCFERNISVVSGTTGWLEHLDEVKKICKEQNKTLFYASNYNMGINIFSAVNKYLAKMMNNFPIYDVNMTEIHHVHKLDYPSGTAINIAEGILESIDRKTQWKGSLENTAATPTPSGTPAGAVIGTTPLTPNDLLIRSKREGENLGVHEVTYQSEGDAIIFRHELKSRRALALGAVLAAEYVKGKKGYLTMGDMFNF